MDKKLLILGAIGFGVYYYWDKVSQQFNDIMNIPNTEGSEAPKAPANQTNNPSGGGSTLFMALSNAAKSHGDFTDDLASFDQWNWLRASAGFAAPQAIEEIFPGMERSKEISLSTYYAGLKAKGIEGLDLSGLAGIVNSNQFDPWLAYNKLTI